MELGGCVGLRAKIVILRKKNRVDVRRKGLMPTLPSNVSSHPPLPIDHVQCHVTLKRLVVPFVLVVIINLGCLTVKNLLLMLQLLFTIGTPLRAIPLIVFKDIDCKHQG